MAEWWGLEAIAACIGWKDGKTVRRTYRGSIFGC